LNSATRSEGLCYRDERAACAVGRTARLELVFERRRGRTIIAHAYVEPPFRIGQSFAIDDAAYVIVVCSGPGVFAGDTLRQLIHVERGARVVLTSQSALQVHPPALQVRLKPDATEPVRLKPDATTYDRVNRDTDGACGESDRAHDSQPYEVSGFSRTDDRDSTAAMVHHEYLVDEDAELHCHWDPVIPFAGAALVQEFDLVLHASSRLYWSDALMSGRATRGEMWRFRELAHTLRLRIGGSLKYLERYRLTPADRSVTRRWVADEANYFATTLVHHPRVMSDEVEALHRQLETLNGARAAVDLLEPQLMLARVMAAHGPPFTAARAAIRRALVDAVFQNPALAGRK